MFKEILKIIPQLENRDLQKMENSLGKRFNRIAKKFGRGLKASLLGGGIAGLAIGLINKILNPLKEVQESIDRTLQQGDDLVTFAKQFGTDAGKLAKLTAFGQASGLQREVLFQMLNQFQTKVAEAQADPNKDTSVRNFVGRTDTADAFFEFIQAMGKMEAGDRSLVSREIFGEDAGVRSSDFIQADFEALNKSLGKISSEKLTGAITKLGGLSDLQDSLAAQRNLEDLINKSGVINSGIIRSQDERERTNLNRETERIKSYESISTISDTSTKILSIVEKGALTLTDMATKLTNLQEFAKKLAPSKIFRGIFGGD